MGKLFVSVGGGGVDTDVVTAGASDVLSGKVIVGPDGEPLTGTLALSGNATAAQVLSGKTFYNTDAKTILTGTMTDRGAQTFTFTPSSGTQTCKILAGCHNGSGVVTCNAIPSTYVNIGSNWTVFNQGTFAANMAFVPNLYLMYGSGSSPSRSSIAISYTNRTYSGVTKKCLNMGTGYGALDGTNYAVILNRAIDTTLFSSVTVGHYYSCNGDGGGSAKVYMYYTYGLDKTKFTKNTGIWISPGFQNITFDISSLSGLCYFGFCAAACHTTDQCGIYSITFNR